MDYSNITNFNPASCISGKMMKCNRIVANVFRKHISRFGVTDSQLSILFIVAKAQQVNQKKLTELLVLEKSTVNRNLKRLLGNELLTYELGSIIVLTDKGKALLEEVIPYWENAMTEIRAALSTEGEDSLNIVVDKLTQIK